jgi:aliphatic nitrilase
MGQPNSPFKVAAVQAASVFLDLDAGVDKAVGLIAVAAAKGAELIAFPEAWLPGYPWWIWLGSPAWGMQFVQRYHENSLVIGSPQYQRLADAARANNIIVVMGHSERIHGSLYLGQAIIDRTGELIQARRKLKPTHVERSVFGDGGGGDLKVHELSIGRVGALCCWEHLQPLSKYAMYGQNEQIHVASWPTFSIYKKGAYALGAVVNMAASRVYAVEGQCYVIAACDIIDERTYGMVVDTPDKGMLIERGGGHAMIFGPDGRELAEPIDEHTDGLVIAEIDLGAIALSKAVADPAGHYARPDVTRLLLNTNVPHPVEFMAAPEPDEIGAPDPA